MNRKKWITMKHCISPLLFLFAISVTLHANAATDEQKTYQDEDVSLRFVQLGPEQIGSFYEGREFKKSAVDKLMSACYVTVIINNLSDDYLWVDTARWEFIQKGKKIPQLDRSYWNKQWDEISLKQAHRSTFNWTLMPAERNLYPQENVGGRVPIQMQSEPFTVVFNFPTGKNKQGKIKTVRVDNVVCKQNDKK